MRAGSAPTDFIAKMDDLRLRLADMEEILDDTYADLLLISFPKEFEFIKQMHHRDRSFTSTKSSKQPLIFTLTSCRANRRGLPSLDAEQLCPPRPTTFSGIGATLMGTTSPTALVSRRHKAPNGANGRAKEKVAILRPSGDPTTKTNSHSDSACYKQKKLKQLAAYFASLTTADRARVADIGSAHIPQTSQGDPPTIGFPFSAMGALLVDAAASLPLLDRPRRSCFPSQQLLQRLLSN